MKLVPDETNLVGRWLVVGESVETDATAKRIELLIKCHLKRICQDPSGWDTLYKDPYDGRYWELTYPSSDYEGGGPPRLACIESNKARAKYGTLVDDA